MSSLSPEDQLSADVEALLHAALQNGTPSDVVEATLGAAMGQAMQPGGAASGVPGVDEKLYLALLGRYKEYRSTLANVAGVVPFPTDRSPQPAREPLKEDTGPTGEAGLADLYIRAVLASFEEPTQLPLPVECQLWPLLQGHPHAEELDARREELAATLIAPLMRALGIAVLACPAVVYDPLTDQFAQIDPTTPEGRAAYLRNAAFLHRSAR